MGCGGHVASQKQGPVAVHHGHQALARLRAFVWYYSFSTNTGRGGKDQEGIFAESPPFLAGLIFLLDQDIINSL
jgi:hypothetical protein